MTEIGQPDYEYIYLDTEEDRKQLIVDIARARLAVLRIVDAVPQDDWYKARYHGWSLGAMLGHLNLADNLSMLLIQAALLGVRPAVPMLLVHRLNHISTRLFQKRLIESSTRSMRRNEKRIADFIMHLPMEKFSVPVFVPTQQKRSTVERAIQDLFLYHWHHHLRTMREVEGLEQPPERSDYA
jgi:predicted alpha/beta-fold hydrolase